MDMELPGTSVHAILLERKGVLQAYAVKKPRTEPKMKWEQTEIKMKVVNNTLTQYMDTWDKNKMVKLNKNGKKMSVLLLYCW